MVTYLARKYNKKSRNLVKQVFRDDSSDRGWIQTSNLLSRNQVRYSVAPRGHFCVCKYSYNCVNCKSKSKLNLILLVIACINLMLL
jgi:hypothetical protein